MTVGLIRSETARDLRTLTATGARRRTRRALTAATAAALALLGAVIGTACAYLALLAWYHRELHWLGHVPVRNLAAILVGLPIVAYVGGWLLAGKETRARRARPSTDATWLASSTRRADAAGSSGAAVPRLRPGEVDDQPVGAGELVHPERHGP